MNKTIISVLSGALLAVAPFSVLSEPTHGLSAFGDLKYAAGFKHFDYVNPSAPKGGRIVTLGTGGLTTFDSLNGFILKGDAAQKLDLLFDTLMTSAGDEPDAMYGLVASSADLSEDKMSVTFKLRPEARFSDGSPLTSADVVKTFELIKEFGHPSLVVLLGGVEVCEAINDHEVTYKFVGENVRDLPMVVAGLPIFSKAYYEKNDFNKTSLKAPLGSGPYKVKELKQGSFITYELRDDYWGKDLPVNVGQNNFGEVKILYFRDRTAELEALKAGVLDLREEFTSKHWATEYDLDAIKEGRLIKEQLPDNTISGAQGFFLNMRREKFADPRTRAAIGLAFDFEWSNANLFYGLYKRTGSYFEGSPFRATGKPTKAELALLEKVRGDIPDSAFGPALEPPKSDGSGQDRKLLRQANKLLTEAGWKRKGSKLVNAKGQTLTAEFLMYSPTFERIIAPFVRNLKLLGVDASIRQVEAAQYQERLKSFDFDISTRRFRLPETMGVELESFFASKTAQMAGSLNMAGVSSKGIDQLIENAIQAKSRDELKTAIGALDRALRGYYFWVPAWHKGVHNVVYWNKFGKPKAKPRYVRGIFETWWVDAEKAAKLKRGS